MACIWVREFKDVRLGAVSFGGRELQFVGWEGCAERQRLLLSQLPVDGGHEVFDDVIQALRIEERRC